MGLGASPSEGGGESEPSHEAGPLEGLSPQRRSGQEETPSVSALSPGSPASERDERHANEKENIIAGPSQPPTPGFRVSPLQEPNLAGQSPGVSKSVRRGDDSLSLCVEGDFPSSEYFLTRTTHRY